MKSKHIGRFKEENNKEFSKMLEESFQGISEMQPGSVHSVKISNIKDKSFVFIQTSTGPGVIQREEFLDRDGELIVGEGEKITAFYKEATNGEMIFTTRPTGSIKSAVLQNALENRTPLKADSMRKIKGGFEIHIGEVMAFCPASQMMEEPTNLEEVRFLVTEINGRRVIVSRRAFREMQREEQKNLLQGKLDEGDIITGNVVSLKDFGAFIDLGGLEGLIPVSEIAFHRVKHPSEELTVGEEVRAKVLSIDWKEDRITLSRKAMLENPWQGKLPFNKGDIVSGTVESVKDFGVFVKITDNFTGLIPMSESNVPRGQNASGVYTRGQELRVMINFIDRERERLSLSIKKVADADTRREYENYIDKMKDDSDQDEGLSSFGRALMQAVDKKK